MKISNDAIDFPLLFCLFASQSFKHGYKFQRKKYFREVISLHINTLVMAWSWKLQDSATLALPPDGWTWPRNKVLLGSELQRMALEAAASCPGVIFLNSHSTWQAVYRAFQAREVNSSVPGFFLRIDIRMASLHAVHTPHPHEVKLTLQF